jgi:bacterioferritin-associated ferredoxin
MYVCICNAKTEKQVRRAIASGANSHGALQMELGVGINCGSCQDQAKSILKENRDSRQQGQPLIYEPSLA